MAINYIYNGQPMVGTAADDFFVTYAGTTGTDNNTVNGNNGDDLVIGDSSDTWIPGQAHLNGTIAAAFNLEATVGPWTSAENEMFGDWTVPHTTAICEATIGQSEFYRVAIGAGEQITIDLDFASNTAIGIPHDLVVELQDSLGNVLVTADDSLVTQGGKGSTASLPGGVTSYDPYLTYTVPSAGIYYINVRPYGDGPSGTFTENNTFVLNVQVTGHAVAALNPVQGADTINGGFGNDTLFGQGGDDVINGDGGDDFIDSGSGGDIVHGGDGNDILYGGDGSEENIHGDNGNDTLISGGEGHYYGDAGNDIVYAGSTSGINEVLDGGADIDTIDTTTWNGSYIIDLVTGATNFGESFINFENIVSGNGADTITGTAGANVIASKGGIDTVNAGGGDDTVAGGPEGDTLDGGIGFDTLDYRQSNGAVTINFATSAASGGHAAGDVVSGFEAIWGSVLGDSLTGDAGYNELRGFEGNDLLSGGLGIDWVAGGINDDTYIVEQGDVVYEAAGQGKDIVYLATNSTSVFALGVLSEVETITPLDRLLTTALKITGSAYANTIYGNNGDNSLLGGGGADTIYGLGGNDSFLVDSFDDQIFEFAGGGNDTVYAQASYVLGAGVVVETLTAYIRTDTVPLNFAGNELANVIYGNDGTNFIDGKGGADTIYLMGGADSVVFTTALGAGNIDKVAGFQTGGDKILLDGVTFAGLAAGALTPGVLVVGGLPADANDRLLYNQASGQLFFDSDGNGAVAAVQFALFDPGTPIGTNDFLVI